MTTRRDSNRGARRLAALLEQHALQLVLAESCTAGLVAATLARVPGISAHLCGSAVVYQVETKSAWLKIPESMLDQPGPVSRVVAAEMAKRVLARTPHANVSAAVTGHLGPGAPRRQDGLAYTAIAFQPTGGTGRSSAASLFVRKLQLEPPPPGAGSVALRALRVRRQQQAALAVITLLGERIERRFSAK